MNNKIMNILNKLSDNHHESYVVGGFVRDYLLGNETYDVDIATNYLPKDVKEILGLSNSNEDNYGVIKIKDSIYNYDITTFRSNEVYENRKPVNYRYTMSINEDVLRRDFTINALYIDSKGNIIDLVDGRKDLENRVIRVIGDISSKLAEDPLRILRAIRFASILDFELESNLYTFIKQNKILISTLSYQRKKEELDLIFKGNSERGIKLIKELDLSDALGIKIPDDIVYSSDLYGIWAQLEISDEYIFSQKELTLIESIKKIISYGIIDNVVLYQYGLYPSIIAGEILGQYRSFVSEIYTRLPIYSSKDIQVTGDDIMNILNIKPGEIIKNIIYDLEIRILNNEILNEKDAIKEYLLNNWR